jgi:hypothetical protein
MKKYIFIAFVLVILSTICFAGDYNSQPAGISGSITSTTQDATIYSANSFMAQKRGTTGDANAAVTSGTGLGVYGFSGWNGTSYSLAGYFSSFANQDWTGSSVHGGSILGYVCPNSAASCIQTFHLNQAGTASIGNNPSGSFPNATLQVKDGTIGTGITRLWASKGDAQATTPIFGVYSSTSGDGPRFEVRNTGASIPKLSGTMNASNQNIEDVGSLKISTTPIATGSYLWFTNVDYSGSPSGSIDLNIYPNDGSKGCTLGIFRNTNGSSSVFKIYKGDNTSTAYVNLSARAQSGYVNGKLRVGDTTFPTQNFEVAGMQTISATLFAALGTPANGTIAYCSDCTTSTPATCTANLLSSCTCAGSGTGAFAKRLNGAWYCN